MEAVSVTYLVGIDPITNPYVTLLGYHAPYDGGSGDFFWDNISTLAQDYGTVFISTYSSITSGRWRRVYSGPLNVRWFGATGDGITDDTLAIQRAISALDLKGTLFFPKGTYLITDMLTINGISLVGEDTENTIIYGANYGICLIQPTDSYITNITLKGNKGEGFQKVLNEEVADVVGIAFDFRLANQLLMYVHFAGTVSADVEIQEDDGISGSWLPIATASSSADIYSIAFTKPYVRGVITNYLGTGNITVHLVAAGSGFTPYVVGNALLEGGTNTTIDNCTLKDAPATAWNASYASDVTLINSTIANTGFEGIGNYIPTAKNIIVRNCVFKDTSKTAIDMNCSNVLIQGNSIDNAGFIIGGGDATDSIWIATNGACQQNITILDNRISNSGVSGIRIHGIEHTLKNVNICNNNITESKLGNGIGLYSTENGEVCLFNVSSNIISNSFVSGINLLKATQGSISSNTIDNSLLNEAAFCGSIWLLGYFIDDSGIPANVSITGNTINQSFLGNQEALRTEPSEVTITGNIFNSTSGNGVAISQVGQFATNVYTTGNIITGFALDYSDSNGSGSGITPALNQNVNTTANPIFAGLNIAGVATIGGAVTLGSGLSVNGLTNLTDRLVVSNITGDKYLDIDLTSSNIEVRTKQYSSSNKKSINFDVDNLTFNNSTIISADQIISIAINYTITHPAFYKLSSLTGSSKNVELPNPAIFAGFSITIWNQNTSSTYSWIFTTNAPIDASGTGISSLNNTTVYILKSDGTNWVKTN